ncbi:2-iminoacetate synthase ThiH, partial [Myxococcota bacterium]
MSFDQVLSQTNLDQVQETLDRATSVQVEQALARSCPDVRDLAAMLSPAAIPFIEQLAQKSASLTRTRFGRTMQLYAPVYLSNQCTNRCAYCGFSSQLGIQRTTLDA